VFTLFEWSMGMDMMIYANYQVQHLKEIL